ncbi:hypothetical protein [Streptomyces sp. TRM68367]|uniref:hypothetical protein n=1 Tax=Streptomyces sp. TRM68367 TaxID=2758415 RepID=UPI00165B58F2|nr:hypothetical protein [Streptomyces sp. TRM68367]MBC9730219.1 hypothetical protein [Streptomyces sp. TRM68367]
MIRLPATHAAITAPLVASNARFPGIPIGRSETDGRPFHLTPVLVDAAILPATNSLALGGLGSGKSTTAKVRSRREILHHNHQYVVIDSFGEETAAGEWGKLTESLGGQIIEAGAFTLNPCSPEFEPDVREQLIRSLIAAVEPAALTPQSTHALQHGLNSPKAGTLVGLVDALVSPEDGRWPADKLAVWGEGVAIALSRYTEGSLCGLFDGPDASLPPTDLPIISFDFSKLDRNSPAIPALMAAIACWVEHVWLRQSTAVHRHLVLEEAWQILLSPATSELIQRLLKNSRKASLSLDVVMHTLSDLGEGRAQDLARLCEIAHVGRLGPEEAAIVGALLGLPAWAIKKIPTLAPGQAVWKVGPDFVDVIQTTIDEEEARLTDTSTRRRKAQEAMAAEALATDEEPAVTLDKEAVFEDAVYEYEEPATDDGTDDGLDFDLPPNVIDTLYTAPQLDYRHHAVLQAAGQGRFNEASELAALGEREDITTHGINSPQATAWLLTRAEMAELFGNSAQAAQLRATVARMGNDNGGAWFEQPAESTAQWHQAPDPPEPAPTARDDQPRTGARRRTWPYVAAIAALALTATGVWQKAENDTKRDERQQKVAAYKGRSGANLIVDSVDADVVAHWTRDGDAVIVELRSSFDPDAKYLRLDADGKSAHSVKKDWYPESPEIELPVKDRYADVTVRVAIGGKSYKEGSRAASRTIRLSPTGVAYDGKTGEKLPSDL